MKAPLAERLYRNIRRADSGCWHWTGRLNVGYGYLGFEGKRILAHRAAYTAFVGPIPEGLTLDHLCHTNDAECPGGECQHRSCVNPDHLEPVTQRENSRRGKRIAAQIATTVCPNPYDDTNTYTSRKGMRACRTCINARIRVYRLSHPKLVDPTLPQPICPRCSTHPRYVSPKGARAAWCTPCKVDIRRAYRARRREPQTAAPDVPSHGSGSPLPLLEG